MPGEQLPWAAAPSLLCCSPAQHTPQHLLPSPFQPLNPSVAESFSQLEGDISMASCPPVGRPWLAVAGQVSGTFPSSPIQSIHVDITHQLINIVSMHSSHSHSEMWYRSCLHEWGARGHHVINDCVIQILFL